MSDYGNPGPGTALGPWSAADSKVFLVALCMTGLSLAGMWALMAATAALWPGPIDLEILGFTASVARDGSSSVGVSGSVLVLLLGVPVLSVLVRKLSSRRR